MDGWMEKQIDGERKKERRKERERRSTDRDLLKIDRVFLESGWDRMIWFDLRDE